jgi:hydrogenase maturation factor HypF (carbamoyltransferase family)
MSFKCKFAERSKPFFITVSVVEYVELFIRMNKMDYLLLTSESRPFGSVKLGKGTSVTLAPVPANQPLGDNTNSYDRSLT